jgi:hypothetical protein
MEFSFFYTEVTGENLSDSPLRPPQIPHGTMWFQTLADTVKTKQLTLAL